MLLEHCADNRMPPCDNVPASQQRWLPAEPTRTAVLPLRSADSFPRNAGQLT
jgi:hypothetical protein